MERLSNVDKHYLRKENQLFPFLEDHGVEGPSSVMWAIHDDIRALVKQARQTIADDDAGLAVSTCLALAKMADDMVTKEEQVLHPMAIGTLADAEWAQIRAGEGDIGYAFIDGVPEWHGRGGRGRGGRRGRGESAGRGRGRRSGGGPGRGGCARRPSRPQHRQPQPGGAQPRARRPPHRLPVRRRARPRALLQRGPPDLPAQPRGDRPQGAELPPAASVHKVQQLIDAFLAGEQSTAEFWIEVGGTFLHIRHFAVRDDAGAYRGVVETVQDVTAIRALEGQRRLLDW